MVDRASLANYHLLQMCLFGQWSYVCEFGFDEIDLNVTLHQIGYTGGGNLGVFYN